MSAAAKHPCVCQGKPHKRGRVPGVNLKSALVSAGLAGEDYHFCFGFCRSDACGPTAPVIRPREGCCLSK